MNNNLVLGFVGHGCKKVLCVFEVIRDAGTVLFLPLLVYLLVSFTLPRAVRAGGDADGGIIVRHEEGSCELIMEPRHGSGMVCIMVAVPAGSAREVPQLRGISHFIEHMTFDGSERYSRKEISDWADDSGAFLNAFTREETTIYFTLVPSYAFEEGLDILSQMLLHSIFPEEEIEKERKVITEEIRKDSDDRSSIRRDLVNRYLFKGSPLVEPVIGTPETVALITRDELIDYYRRYYSPGLMRIYIVGDFDPGAAETLVASYFAPTGREDDEGEEHDRRLMPRGVRPPVFENRISFVRRDDVGEGLDLLVEIPADELEDLPEALLMVEMLGDFGGPVEAIKERFGLKEARAELVLRSSFMAVRFHFGGIGCNREKITEIVDALRGLSGWKPKRERFEAVAKSFFSRRMFDREKFHYFVMLEGERIGTLGSGYLVTLERSSDEVDRADCIGLAKKTFGDFKYNGCYVAGCPEIGGGTGRSSWHVATLGNGCRVIASERKDSSVFAAVVLAEKPACLESGYFPGAVSVLHLLYENSSSGREFAEELSTLGAEVEWRDNPYIPFDDYLINPSASFVRLLAPRENGPKALHMLVEYMLNPRFTDEDLEGIRRKVAVESAMRRRSQGFMRRGVVFSTLFPRGPFSYPLYPSQRDLAGVSLEKIEELRTRYLSAGNMVVSIVSPLGWDDSKELLTGEFSCLKSSEPVSCGLSPDKSAYGKRFRRTLPFNSLYMERLWVFDFSEFDTPGGPSEGGGEEGGTGLERMKAASLVACEVLSRRMQENIREKCGLAYSTGCSVLPLSGAFILRAYLGTGVENFSRADSVMGSCIEGIVENPPGDEEVELARRRVTGRMLRRELSSGSRAYMLGFGFLAANRGEIDEIYPDLLPVVSPDEVRIASARLFSRERMVSIDIFPEGKGDAFKP